MDVKICENKSSIESMVFEKISGEEKVRGIKLFPLNLILKVDKEGGDKIDSVEFKKTLITLLSNLEEECDNKKSVFVIVKFAIDPCVYQMPSWYECGSFDADCVVESYRAIKVWYSKKSIK